MTPAQGKRASAPVVTAQLLEVWPHRQFRGKIIAPSAPSPIATLYSD